MMVAMISNTCCSMVMISTFQYGLVFYHEIYAQDDASQDYVD